MSAKKNFESFRSFLFENCPSRVSHYTEDEGRKVGVKLTETSKYGDLTFYIFPFHFTQKGIKEMKKRPEYVQWKQERNAVRGFKSVVRKL